MKVGNNTVLLPSGNPPLTYAVRRAVASTSLLVDAYDDRAALSVALLRGELVIPSTSVVISYLDASSMLELMALEVPPEAARQILWVAEPGLRVTAGAIPGIVVPVDATYAAVEAKLRELAIGERARASDAVEVKKSSAFRAQNGPEPAHPVSSHSAPAVAAGMEETELQYIEGASWDEIYDSQESLGAARAPSDRLPAAMSQQDLAPEPRLPPSLRAPILPHRLVGEFADEPAPRTPPEDLNSSREIAPSPDSISESTVPDARAAMHALVENTLRGLPPPPDLIPPPNEPARPVLAVAGLSIASSAALPRPFEEEKEEMRDEGKGSKVGVWTRYPLVVAPGLVILLMGIPTTISLLGYGGWTTTILYIIAILVSGGVMIAAFDRDRVNG